MKRIALALLLLAGALALRADAAGPRQLELCYKLDLSATSYTYYLLRGMNNDPWNGPIAVTQLVATSGSSTTITAVTAASGPFTNVAAGDTIYINAAGGLPGPPTKRVVVTRTSADEVVVDAAVTIPASGTTFGYKRSTSGTGANDGLFGISGYSSVTVFVDVATINATSIDVSYQCRGAGSDPATLLTATLTTTGAMTPLTVWSGAFDDCRVGLKVSGDAGTQSVSAYVAMR